MIDLVLTIIEQACLYIPLAVGAYLIFSLMRVPGLSIESAFVTGAVWASLLLGQCGTGIPLIDLPLACVASLLGGAFIGGLVATLVVYCRVPHLLANILVLGMGYGANLLILGSSNRTLGGIASPLTALPIATHPELITLLIIALCTVLSVRLLCSTQLGVSIAVYGNNPQFFQQYGIAGGFVLCAGFSIGNALAGLSGYLVAQSSGFVDIGAGASLVLFCITTLVLGRTMCMRIRSVISFLVPLSGIVSYCVLQQVLLKIGFNLKYFMVLQAVMVLGILLLRYRVDGAPDSHADQLGV